MCICRRVQLKTIKYKITPFIIKDHKIGSGVIIFVLCSFSVKFVMLIITEMSTIILLINVKMPTIVGILIFMSSANTTSECFKQEKSVNFQYFTFYEQLKFRFIDSGRILII